MASVEIKSGYYYNVEVYNPKQGTTKIVQVDYQPIVSQATPIIKT